ncbi:hypothetical protein C4580_06580 [Candidatus Woesearchaeota archaeon]|nr:MAG: hypothetical protein C4580_06580 [Candidatus Woesearchaeota archaeon]
MRKWLWLGVLVVALFAVRMFFALQTPYLSSDESYLYVRGADALADGRLLWFDALGFGGRLWLRSPVFEAFVALASFVLPFSLAVKVVPNFFAALVAVPVFLIAFELTRNDRLSLAASLLAGLVPVFFGGTFNQLSPVSLALFLFFSLVYLWMARPIPVPLFLVLLLLFVFVHPLSVIFVLGLLCYFLLQVIDGQAVEPTEFELGLFTVFFSLWAQFLVYKRAFLVHGAGVIWQNIPDALRSEVFASISLLEAIVLVGAYPLAEGIYALYRSGGAQDRRVNVLLGITVLAAGLLWFKLVDLLTGLMVLGIVLAILFAKWSDMFLHFLRLTKVSRYAGVIVSLSVVFALVTTAVPAYALVQSQVRQTITQEEVRVLSDLGARGEGAVVAPVEFGHYVEWFAGLPTVIDAHFLLRPKVEERYRDVTRVFRTFSETEAVMLMAKYNATYIVVPVGYPDIKYGEGKCFDRVWAGNMKVYEKDSACEVRVVS